MSAADRLLGGLVDIPAAYVDGVAERIRARSTVKKDLIEIQGNAAKAKLALDQDAGDRLLVGMLREEERKLGNRTAVVIEAVEDLKRLPPPSDSASQSGEPELDPDWINVFSGHTANASSEHMRQMWGRILAGEIRQPGSFSLSTLRLMAEMDRQIATLFQKAMRDRLSNGMLPKPKEMKGKNLLELTSLEEFGLLQEVNGSLGLEIKRQQDGYHYFLDGHGVLRVRAPEGMETIRASFIKITRVGQELASILPPSNSLAGLKQLGLQLADTMEEVTLNLLTSQRSDGTISFSPIETIKAAEPKPSDG